MFIWNGWIVEGEVYQVYLNIWKYLDKVLEAEKFWMVEWVEDGRPWKQSSSDLELWWHQVIIMYKWVMVFKMDCISMADN